MNFIFLMLLLFSLNVYSQGVSVLPGVQICRLSDPDITEISGIAMSRSLPNTLWGHQDSGSDPVFYGIDLSTGNVHSRILLQNAPAIDWEDMTIAPSGTGTYDLYFGDIGDNGANRNTGIDIIRIKEPLTLGNDTFVNADYKVKRVVYPGTIFLREEDAESMFADPASGDLYIIQKLNPGPGKLFMLPAAEFNSPGTFTLIPYGEINAPLVKPTSADISPDGKYIIVRNSSNGGTIAWLFVRDLMAGQTIESALKGNPIRVDLESESQGEAIAWAADGSGFYSLSEGQNSPVRFYQLIGPSSSQTENASANNFQIYPNPVKDQFTLSIPCCIPDKLFTLNWYNLNGQLMHSEPLISSNGASQISINRPAIPSGLYLLHLAGSGSSIRLRTSFE
jgi:hypothetical protein